MSYQRKFPVKAIVLASALVACMSGAARADDSSMSRFGGDSYAYFNQAPVVTAPSTWRQDHPHGVSESALESESSEALASDLQRSAPVYATSSDPTFRQTHPNGLTERELQALSSESSAWQLRSGSAQTAVAATTSSSDVAQAPANTVASRLAAMFHARSDADASTTR